MKVRIELDERRVIAVVERGNFTALRRVGAYVRKAARNRVSLSPRASLPGTPPNTRRGLLKNALLFGVEKDSMTVVIGPAQTLVGTSMWAHEFGGRYKKQRYPKRPLMGPVLEATESKLPKLWENAVK